MEDNIEQETVISEEKETYKVLALHDVIMPGVRLDITSYFSYNIRLLDSIQVGDLFVLAYSTNENAFSRLNDSLLPGFDIDTAVICRLESISKSQVSYNFAVTGIEKVKVVNTYIDPDLSLVKIDGVAVREINDVKGKLEAFNKFRNHYEQFKKVHTLFPPLPDFSETQIDLVPYKIADFLNASVSKKIDLLKVYNTVTKFKICDDIVEEYNFETKIEFAINSRVAEDMSKNQREFILRSKAKAVHNMLKEFDGVDNEEKYQKIIDEHPEDYPEEILNAIKAEISKFKSIPSVSPEAGITLNYLDLLTSLPYKKSSEDNHDISDVKRVLDESHYGLEKQKDRIIQYLAVKEVTKSLKSPILCFYGPPGAGKTSLAVSISKALHRKFEKVALGGVHDESEIRGHRRTYVGALPGKILTAVKKAGVNNPLILLDEIDKVEDGGYHGNPASALLEVLDPEQNQFFEDNYLAHPFDLSHVLFICTANNIRDIPAPLLDRLEMIPLYSYTMYEKMHIARDYVMQLEYEKNGVDKDKLFITDEALEFVIERYTMEAGVRNLQRQLGTICRKFIVEYLDSNKTLDKVVVDVEKVKQYLGKPLYTHDKKVEDSQVGIVNGLAYTDFGGEVLQIEVNCFKGKGEITRTGNLGDVMKEACSTAYSYIRSVQERFGLTKEFFEETSIHIHFPDTATPKDGPSAGLATAIAILSALTNKKIRNDVAMTGEIDLRGNAMQIGGLREKTMAAVREHIKVVLCPEENIEDVKELPKEVKDSIEIVTIKKFDEAINYFFMENPYVGEYQSLYHPHKVEDVEKTLNSGK